jgi:uncharacterized protein
LQFLHVKWGKPDCSSLPCKPFISSALAMDDPCLLIVFVKAPRPGSVKTRLAQAVGPVAACDAYRVLVNRVLDRIAAASSVQIRFGPDNAEDEIRHWMKPGWTLARQGYGDLGERLQRAFADAFASGARRVAIIGSDCPYLGFEDVVEAWRALDTHDVVLGPASDGGYWLIALRETTPKIFEAIPWGTAEVLNRTLSQIDAAKLRRHLLRELRDIDTVKDWQAYLAITARDSDLTN